MANMQKFEASSAAFPSAGTIPLRYAFNDFGCTGENISPQVGWKNAPEGTQSFALMVHDPDAPTGGAGFWHWVVVNIPASTSQLPEGAGAMGGEGLPAGAAMIPTDYGIAAYGGPCPPVGDAPHHYNFTVYALKVPKLDLPANATASLTGFMIHMNMLGKADFHGRFGR
ncbi:MAG: YbhB/YbcL family Raf kinase inhibitor-like protein [Hyphomicrobiales bacterium]|nr:YbhB/YbcL family Raf kinase inhibitor-like protein [Hyphomicrobiales bacterium]MDE2114648.1 YbhB/YbcL family Raf kinase inhibitor-like protein [Hyphomicrobiales bacterium]